MTHPPPAHAGHILSFAQTLKGGGVERALLRLAGEWAVRGRRVTLVIGDPAGPLADELPAGVEVLSGGGGGYLAMARAAIGAVRATRPDVIFCPGNHYTGAAALLRPFAKVPIVAKLSNALAGTHRGATGLGYRGWLRLHPAFVDHLVAMTPASAEEARAVMRMPAGRISVIANPAARRREDAVPVALPAGRFILGVGRLAPQKRWERLVAAMPPMPADVSLLILGEGPARAAIEAQAAALGVGDRIHLPGHVADPLPAMAAATVVALTSDHEGVPGVLREALGEGTPVVSTDSSVAIPELIDTPAKGSIVARGDAAALVAALDRWLSPNAVRPQPTHSAGDPAGDYLTLLDDLVRSARRRRGAPR
jgi:glycosyltransferase involved in cell wall biosynthesis